MAFVYEYFCGGAAAGRADLAALQAEGQAMLSAVLQDLSRVPGVETLTLFDPALLPVVRGWPVNISLPLAQPDMEELAFRELARAAQCSLVIAPECDGLLAERCRWVEEEGGRLLGPSSAAVQLTGDKLELARHLLARGVPTPPSAPWPGAAPPFAFPLVCKPRFGAGSQATFLVWNDNELSLCIKKARAEGREGEMIVQPRVPGRAVSVAFLTGPGRPAALPAAEQVLSDDGRFHYQGGRLPLADDLNRRAQRLAERAVATVEGLCGYVGVDLVVGAAADGSGDRVIEINPRLTTSYVGLRALARFNLAEALLAAASGAPLPPLLWRPGPVHFCADGSVS
jgi:predicted ATP-grasp superfamily ATP-dependent carboligase